MKNRIITTILLAATVVQAELTAKEQEMMENNAAVYEIGSGTYQFQFSLAETK